MSSDDKMDIETTSSGVDDVPVKASLPWVEKYRPSTFQDLIAHEDILSILEKLIETKKLPHLLFHGPPGKLFTVELVY